MEVIKIKNILTAIGDPLLNTQLKELGKFNIINKDIQYQDGVLEILELNKNINFLIINNTLPGELKFSDLIEKIQEKNSEIKIIIILQKNDLELEKILIKKGVYRILNKNINLNNLLKIINEDEKMEKYNQEIENEINKLKKHISKKNNKSKNKLIKNSWIFNIEKNKKIINKVIIKYFKKIINKKLKKQSESKKHIISIFGNNGSGKSIFSVLLSKELKKYNKKIIILDFDIFNNSIHTILGVKRLNKEKNINNNLNILDYIIKINKNIDLISEVNFIFNYENLRIITNKLLEKYDVIIIDTTSEKFFEFNKEILNVSDINIFLTENNISEISKSKRILKKYICDWNVEKDKIKIIFNKCNKIKINFNILKNIYFEYEILGFLKYSINYNFFINRNFKCKFWIEKNLNKIVKKLLLELE